MRIVQFEIPQKGRRVGVVDGDAVRDVTAVKPEWKRVVDVAEEAIGSGCTLAEALAPAASGGAAASGLSYQRLLAAEPGESGPFLHPPFDHADPRRVLVSGTGLTHLGSMQSRDHMHAPAAEPEEAKSDSKKMFELGLAGGKPEAGQRGVAPEWFYKGDGTILRGPRHPLELPEFALDGGEEAEVVGLYLIDELQTPRRLGFALGNEWSDHATEKINYLYLAPSKLRQCAIGPELVTGFAFESLELRCTVERGGKIIYDSGPLMTGEQHMSHSLANLEDHHFKFAQHRQPGSLHVHFFGTSKLSHTTRDWRFADGDEIRIAAEGFSAPLVNRVRTASDRVAEPIRVVPL